MVEGEGRREMFWERAQEERGGRVCGEGGMGKVGEESGERDKSGERWERRGENVEGCVDLKTLLASLAISSRVRLTLASFLLATRCKLASASVAAASA